MAFAPGTQVLFITEKPGTMKFVDLASGAARHCHRPAARSLYGGQGGLGDVAFLPAKPPPRSAAGRST